jgi:hypothetical protein
MLGKLGTLDLVTQRKVGNVLAELKRLGYKPVVVSGRRTLDEQRALVARGRSRTLRSLHLLGRAADVVPAVGGYAADNAKQFWVHMAIAAAKQGLLWGGLWGLNPRVRARLARAVASGDYELACTFNLGWDPSHLEDRR